MQVSQIVFEILVVWEVQMTMNNQYTPLSFFPQGN